MVDDIWLNWDYINYCEPPHSWMRRNIGRNKKIIRKEQPKTYGTIQHTSGKGQRTWMSLLWWNFRQGIEWQRLSSASGKRNILVKKVLRFNCSGKKQSLKIEKKITCKTYSKPHRFSICDQRQSWEEKCPPVTTTSYSSHSGGKGLWYRMSYLHGLWRCWFARLCENFWTRLGRRPVDVQWKKVVMLMVTTTARMEIHKVTVAT